MRLHQHIPVVLAIAAQGCLGTISDTRGDAAVTATDSLEQPFTCDPSQALVAAGMNRLTKTQLTYTLHDLLERYAGSDAEELIAIADAAAGAVPDDTLTEDDNQVTMSQTVSEAHIDGYYAIGRALGTAIAAKPALIGACATDATTTNDVECVTTWIAQLGRLFYRRPLLEAEIADAVEIYDNAKAYDAEGIADVVTSFMLAPQFVYRIERGAGSSGTDALTYDLSAYELASRLAYHFWQSMPDEELMQLAEDGSLLTDAVYQEQLDRIFADVKTRRASDAFYYGWLNLDRIPDMTTNMARPDFIAYAGTDLPTAELRDHLIADVQDMVAYYSLGTGKLSDLFTNTASFARTSDVAALYGNVPVWDGTSAPPQHVQAGRVGVLSQAGLLANDQATTRPILRGVFVLKRLLCDTSIGAAQGADTPLPAADLTQMSTRDRVAMLTQTPGETCAGCHNTINPLGFAREDFDGLGRARTQETVYNGETGAVVMSIDVDSSSDIPFDGQDPIAIAGSSDLSAHLATSQAVQACFVRNYVRFAFGRVEDRNADGCLMTDLHERIAQGGSLPEVMKSIALTDEFRRIRKEDAPEEVQ